MPAWREGGGEKKRTISKKKAQRFPLLRRGGERPTPPGCRVFRKANGRRDPAAEMASNRDSYAKRKKEKAGKNLRSPCTEGGVEGGGREWGARQW